MTLLVLVGGLATVVYPRLRPQSSSVPVGDHVVTIRVEGTSGVSFEGGYGTPLQMMAVNGRAPATYQFRTAVGVVARFTKVDVDGELILRVLVDGREVQRKRTTQPYGNVFITSQFIR